MPEGLHIHITHSSALLISTQDSQFPLLVGPKTYRLYWQSGLHSKANGDMPAPHLSTKVSAHQVHGLVQYSVHNTRTHKAAVTRDEYGCHKHLLLLLLPHCSCWCCSRCAPVYSKRNHNISPIIYDWKYLFMHSFSVVFFAPQSSFIFTYFHLSSSLLLFFIWITNKICIIWKPRRWSMQKQKKVRMRKQ